MVGIWLWVATREAHVIDVWGEVKIGGEEGKWGKRGLGGF